MRPPFAEPEPEPERRAPGFLLGQDGACARLVFSWMVAGGIAGGGLLVGLLTVARLVSPGFQLLAAPVLFLLGAFLGGVHAAILAVVGRPRGLTRGGATRKALWAILAAIPALLPAWLVTAGISISAALVKEWRMSWGLLALVAALIGIAVCTWAAREGWQALCRAYARWPESKAGSVVTGVLLVVVSVASVRMQPELLGTGLKLNGVGAVILALAVTLWIGFPIVWVVLHLAHEWITPHAGSGQAGTS